MARTHARIYTSVWLDEDFVTLSQQAQHLYMLICSQQTLSWAGVIAYTPKRWARLAKGSTPKLVTAAAAELAREKFVLIDEDTEELWVRTFVRHDGVLKIPQLRRAMWESLAAVQSQRIRDGFAHEYPDLSPDPNSTPPRTRKPTGTETGPPTGTETRGETRPPTGTGKGIKVVSSTSPTPSPSPPPSPRGASNKRADEAAKEEAAEVISISDALRGGAA